MHPTPTTSFLSQGQRCAAWITCPDGEGPHPAVVLVHGFGATHDMRLEQYERAFADAGMVVLSFDFRHLGASDGMPRQLVSIPRQLADIDAALAFLAGDPRVDPARIALWGTSMGATHVLLTAAKHPGLAAAVVQCPVMNTMNAAFSSGLGAVARLAGPIAVDLIRAVLRLPRRYVPLVDDPGRTAIVTVPGAKDGWYGMLPPGASFDNRVTASVGFELVRLNASRRAASIQAPLLVCVSDRETLTDPRIAARTARSAPRGTALHYPADHFEVYHPPLLDDIIRDQVAFLTRHLRLTALSEAGRD
ncbi:alpha/beta hydrolase [Streptomyces sp. NPDC087420]|uniref:alpha/beta hydrolase n=1 Tax=Streptomyces sp. NPDC087420 TaxID=3365785 RepID=UPI0038327886